MEKVIKLLLLIFTVAYAKEYKVISKIDRVTVFPNNAKIYRSAKVYIPTTGIHDIVIKDLSPYIIEKHIQVSGKGNATILAVSFTKNYLNDEDNPRIKPIKDSLQFFKDKLKRIEKQKEVLKAEKEFLEANQEIKGEDKNLTVAELQYMLAFYRKELKRISSEELKLIKEERIIKDKISKLTNQLNELRGTKYAEGNIKITVDVKKAGNLFLEISYLVYMAGWQPEYFIKCEEVNKPIKFTLVANVKQNTGVDWKNVLVEITTADPLEHFSLPTINPIYVSLFEPYKPQKTKALREEDYDYFSDADDFSFSEEDSEDEPAPEIEQSHHYSSLTKTETHQTYSINLKYTILSNDKVHKIVISEDEVDTEYEYLAIPKKREAVFLTAIIKNINRLALISASGSIIYKNQLAGTIYINPNTTEDLKIPLGIDKDIAIKYEVAEKFTKVKTIGTHIKEQKGYKITIRNNKTFGINIKIKDQVPLSSHSMIEIEVEQLSGGNYNPETGIIEWNVKVPANSTKEIIFSYSIKYPKGKKITIR